MAKQKTRSKRSFSPLYLAILSGILLIILIINGFLEMNRTRNGFYLLLEREATVLLQHYEKSIQDTLSNLQPLDNPSQDLPLSLTGSFSGIDESIAEYLIDAAHRIDQMDTNQPLDAKDLQSLVNQYGITSIEIYNPEGHRIKGWPLSTPSDRSPFLRELFEKKRSVVIDLFGKPLTGEGQSFSIAIWRKDGAGIISLHLDSGKMRKLLYQFAIQKAISDIGFREGVLYVSVQDAQFNILAHTDPGLIGKKEEDPFLKSTFQNPRPLFRHRDSSEKEEVFEVAKSFYFKGRPMGVIRIGYSSKEIHSVLSQIERTVILVIFLFVILGISAIALIWTNQNRHLQKVKEMEDQIQLADRLSSLGHLAAGVAHEIRNPLNAIGMGMQRLKREFLPQEETRQKEYRAFTELILREIRRVNEIIEQFLTLSRPFQLQLRESSLENLLRNLMTLFREEASSQGIKLEAAIDSDLPLIRVDEEKLTQALINIMKNGMQAMEQGGILRIEAHSARDWVKVEISDTGNGIVPDQMEKVFDYYYTTKEKGVGLGLPIAHRIIEAHAGQLKLDSRVGVGTKVTILLPVK